MAELRVKGTGTLKLFESDNTSSVTIASPASLGADRTITLPDGDVTLVAGTMSTGFAVTDITGQTALGATPADTDEFVLSDAGVLKRVDYSYIKGSTNNPSFKVHQSALVTCTTATWTTVTYNTELFDSDGCFNTGTYQFTPTTAGYYFFYAGGWWNATDDFDGARIVLYKNTSRLSAGNTRNFFYAGPIATSIVHMNGSSDTMAVQVKQDSGEDKNFYSTVYDLGFGGFLINAA